MRLVQDRIYINGFISVQSWMLEEEEGEEKRGVDAWMQRKSGGGRRGGVWNVVASRPRFRIIRR